MIIIIIKLLTCCVKMYDIMFKLYFLKKLLVSITLILTLLSSILMLSLNMKMTFYKMIIITVKFKIIIY